MFEFELVLVGLIMVAIGLIGMCICEKNKILLEMFAYAAFSACVFTVASAIVFFIAGGAL